MAYVINIPFCLGLFCIRREALGTFEVLLFTCLVNPQYLSQHPVLMTGMEMDKGDYHPPETLGAKNVWLDLFRRDRAHSGWYGPRRVCEFSWKEDSLAIFSWKIGFSFSSSYYPQVTLSTLFSSIKTRTTATTTKNNPPQTEAIVKVWNGKLFRVMVLSL